MLDQIADQLFGLNGLVNLSNLIFLAAFSVRDVLYLRVLSIAAYVVIIPYYYLQQETLWPPIFWGVAFILVNAVRVVILMLERRPVVFTEEECTLYRLAFSSIDKREFLKLLNLAEWSDAAPGDKILEKGKPVDTVTIMTSGRVEALADGDFRADIRPGQLIGTAAVLSDLGSRADAVVREPSRLVRWNVAQANEFLASRPELRAQIGQMGNRDLAEKLHQLGDHAFRMR